MYKFFSRHSTLALDYRILFSIFVFSYLIFPLLSDFKPINFWLFGCLLLLVVLFGYCYPLKQFNFVSRFSSFALSAISSRFFGNSLIIILLVQIYLLLSTKSYDLTSVLQNKIVVATEALSSPLLRYVNYSQSAFPVITMIYLECRIKNYFSLGAVITYKTAMLFMAKHCKVAFLILLLSSSSSSKAGLAAPLMIIGFLFSPYVPLITILTFFSVVFCALLLGFYFFFANSNLIQAFDSYFILNAIYLRLLGTSHDALNAINQIYANIGSINYPFKSIFYPLGFIYSRFVPDFSSVGFWLEKSAYGNEWGGGPNPGFIGDYVLAIPFELSVLLCYFLGSNMRFSIQLQRLPLSFSYIFYTAIIDLHSAILSIFMVSLLSFIFFITERCTSYLFLYGLNKNN